jgi:hypothetical protein
MTSDSGNSNRDHWQAKARRVARQVNFAWWLETLAAPMLVAALVAAAALLVVRREFALVEPWWLGASVGGGVLLLAVGCWARAVGKFEKSDESLVRIEAAMGLKNSLTAARAGVAPWPAPAVKVEAGLVWQWPRLLVPPLGSLVLLAAGLLIPVTARSTDRPSSPEQPQAWKQLDSDLNRLTKEEVVDEKYLEETRKRLEELKSQEEEQWFSHSSLEATDSLKKSHATEAERVRQELGRAEKALGDLEKNAGTASPAEKNRLMEEFDQALQGLQSGAMKPNPALLEQMKQLDLKDMANLKPEEMAQLRENLKKHADAMKAEKGEGAGDDWSDELLAGEDGKDGKEGDGPGNGGVDRGPGHSPGVLGEEKDALETGALTGLQAQDLSRTTPGDLLELQDGQHEVDQSPSKVTGGGNTEATGKGGDRVWKDALDPAEQRTLKRFFE